ncbi:addiction module antitoxin RelB [Pandoraea horticolens]|uniref:Addiction module antitoxin RelB n=1 Tax=Pandoraea horticolens TaxID=2508298 RepID=A0A5E4TIB3_9BURK|nr:addiction module antitoxin RelB [Pandoraea horticolens]
MNGNVLRAVETDRPVHAGPSYRAYFAQRGAVLVILLCSGDKSTQAKDIKRTKKLTDELEN